MSKARELAELGAVYDSGALSSRNIIINGAHTVDQRNSGSSQTVANSTDTFIADRFRFNENSSATFSAQQVSDAPVGFEKSSKITVTGTDSSLAATEFHRILQPIEGSNISHLNWGSSNAKTLTLTFHVKSSLTGQFYVFAFNSAANRTFLSGYTIDSANTWEKKTITITGDTSGTWLTTTGAGIYLGWSLGTGSTYQSNTLDAFQAGFFMAKSDQVNFGATNSATWQITGCQLEVGTEATPFEHRSFGDELARCQRYCVDLTPTSGTTPYLPGSAAAANSTVGVAHVALPVQMRATPSLEFEAAGNYRLYNGGTLTATGIGINGMSPVGGGINFTVSSGLATAEAVGVFAANGTDRTLCVAEL